MLHLPRLKLRRARWILGAAAALALVVPVQLTAPARADQPVAEDVGTWRPTVRPPSHQGDDYAQYVNLYGEPATRRLYAEGQAWLAVYDLDNLQPLSGGLALPGEPTTEFTDPTTGSILLAFLSTAGQVTTGKVTLVEYGLRNRVLAQLGAVDLTASLSGRQIVGIARSPGSSAYWLLSELAGDPFGHPGGGLEVTEVDLSKLEANAAAVHWTQSVSDCQMPITTQASIPAALGYNEKAKTLYFGCGVANTANYTAPLLRGVGRLSLVPDANGNRPFTIFARDGDFSLGDTYWDPTSKRLVLTASNGGRASLYVFDGTTDTYVGGIAEGGNLSNQSTIDPSTGRYYGLNPGGSIGLLMSDLWATPIGQGVVVPSLTTWHGRNLPVKGPMVVDPVTRRLFLKYSAVNEFRIVRDNYPPYVAPSDSNPDINTRDIDEVPGVTDATFSASAQGFGMQARQVGGAQALTLNTLGVDVRPFPVGAGTREVRDAFLNGLAVTDSEASASAIAADRDQANTQDDINKTTPPGNADPAVNWPYSPAKCFDFGSAPQGDTQTGATANCDAQNNTATAQAQLDNMSVNSAAGSVSMLSASMTASARLDKTLGIVSTVSSVANGVDILGVLHFGKVTAVAKSWARGRPGTANSTYQRTVTDATLNGQILCKDTCDWASIQNTVNSNLSGRVRIDFPSPDATYLHGSRRGYQALVQRSPAQQLQEVLFNEQPNDRTEVPAMVVTVYEDNEKPGRTIYEFAGVEAEARYGISLTDVPVPDTGPGPTGPTGLLPALPIDGPAFGLPPATEGAAPVVGARPLRGPASEPGGAVGKAARLIFNGVGRLGALLPIWAVLLVPIYLSARRWLLLQRSSLLLGGRR